MERTTFAFCKHGDDMMLLLYFKPGWRGKSGGVGGAAPRPHLQTKSSAQPFPTAMVQPPPIANKTIRTFFLFLYCKHADDVMRLYAAKAVLLSFFPFLICLHCLFFPSSFLSVPFYYSFLFSLVSRLVLQVRSFSRLVGNLSFAAPPSDASRRWEALGGLESLNTAVCSYSQFVDPLANFDDSPSL